MIPIADAHCHFWDLQANCYPWLEVPEPEGPFGRTNRIAETYLPADYRADAAHQDVRLMVHIEAGWNPDDPFGEIEWIQRVSEREGMPHGHIAHVDLASPDMAALLDRHRRFPIFRGVRDRLFDGDFTKSGGETRIDDPAWRRGMAQLERHGLAFDLQAPPAIADKAAALARAHPGMRFALTGAGYPPSPKDRDAFNRWRDAIAALAAVPNVTAKLACLPLTERAWVPEHAEEASRVLIDAFGPDRVMLASNFPVDRLFVSMDTVFGHVRRWIADRPDAEQRAILHDNTVRFYRLTGVRE